MKPRTLRKRNGIRIPLRKKYEDLAESLPPNFSPNGQKLQLAGRPSQSISNQPSAERRELRPAHHKAGGWIERIGPCGATPRRCSLLPQQSLANASQQRFLITGWGGDCKSFFRFLVGFDLAGVKTPQSPPPTDGAHEWPSLPSLPRFCGRRSRMKSY